MENINLAGSDNSPEVVFDFANNTFALRGMSYMEDTSGFYDTIIEALNGHLDNLSGTEVRFEFALTYFNSSSSRIIFRLFDKLDEIAESGNPTTIFWFHEDDEDILEQGEEFAEDLSHATFTLVGEQD